jgi:hypothetical protein
VGAESKSRGAELGSADTSKESVRRDNGLRRR